MHASADPPAPKPGLTLPLPPNDKLAPDDRTLNAEEIEAHRDRLDCLIFYLPTTRTRRVPPNQQRPRTEHKPRSTASESAHSRVSFLQSHSRGVPAISPSPTSSLAKLIVAGDARGLDLAMSQGTKPSAPAAEGESLLILAIGEKQWDCLRVLLSRGVDPNVAVERDSSPWVKVLSMMQFNDNGDAAEQIICAGVSVDNRDEDRRTALMYAARANRIATGRMIGLGANPNLSDDAGWTALMYACATDSSDYPDKDGPAIVEMLLRAGADTSLRDRNGKTALDVALSQLDPREVTHRIVELLTSRRE